MALELSTIQEKIVAAFGNDVAFIENQDVFTLEIGSENLKPLILFLKNDPELRFNFLTDLCGMHLPDNDVAAQFAVVYHLHNWIDNVRIRIKTYLRAEQPEVKSITNIFLCANWMERETYDFFGIHFTGHPQLKRILNMDQMKSFPLRKEYPMEDSGRSDKDDRFFGRTVANCN